MEENQHTIKADQEHSEDKINTTAVTTSGYVIPSFLDILLQSEFRILHQEPPLQAKETRADRHLIDLLLQKFWDPAESRALLNQQEGINNDRKEFTYGELTPTGTRQLMEDLELLGIAEGEEQIEKAKVVFYDLGSGEGKATVQVLLERLNSTTSITNMDQVVGIELSPARHAMAVQSWNKLEEFLKKSGTSPGVEELLASNKEDKESQQDHPVENMAELQQALDRLRHKFNHSQAAERLTFIHGNLLEEDFSNATHIFASSIFFPADVLDAMSRKIIINTSMNNTAHAGTAPGNLKMVAALSDLELLEDNDPSNGTCPWEKKVQRLQMSWGGANVRLYSYKDY